jgi:hypothetical protein
MTHVNAQFPLAPSLFIVKVSPHFHPSRIAGRFFPPSRRGNRSRRSQTQTEAPFQRDDGPFLTRNNY